MHYCGSPRLSRAYPDTQPSPNYEASTFLFIHILIRQMPPFPETPDCHSPLSTWGATDHHHHHHCTALRGQEPYGQLKIFPLPSAFSELLVCISLLRFNNLFYFFTHVNISQYHLEGLFHLILPASSSAPKPADKKMKTPFLSMM